jgi:deoxyribonuclease V
LPPLPNPDLHQWNIPVEQAIVLQHELATRLVSDRRLDLTTLRLIAGVDVSVKAEQSRAAIVVLNFPALEILETATATLSTPFPYVPGLLSFREGAVILAAYEKLTHTPDVLIFDGQGQAHPRRLGIAAHLGLWIERPTIGCAKSRLIGHHAGPGNGKGDFAPLLGNKGEVIGVVLRTRPGVKPVYVSPGHLCDLDSARRVVMACVKHYRLPEPTRRAHQAAGLWK